MSGLNGFHSGQDDPSKHQRSVLVVDADVGVVHSLAHALRREGFAVLEATSFQEGKALWASRSPDVLIVDVRLGQFNGLQLLMRARSDRPDLQAIITCPFADAVLEAETRRFGGTFLLKPLEPGQIVAAVRQSTGAETMAVPVPVTPPYLLERRRAERRIVSIPGFFPDRRIANRRVPPEA